MGYDLKDLFDTLPALHRLRDADQGRAIRGRIGSTHSLRDPADFGPLKSLLSVMIREGQIVEEDILQMFDDHFIETCDPWLIPYIGELVGARPLEDFGDNQSARQWVALTLALRQRKGTLGALEFAARAATGWPVVAVEYWSRIATTESLRRVRRVGGTTDLNLISALSRTGTAFDTTPRSPEFGRIDQGAGRWNLPNIGLHFCRLDATPLGTPMARRNRHPVSLGHLVLPTHGRSKMYRFSPFSADQPLFQRPALEALSMDHRASERNLPIAITRQMLADAPRDFSPHSFKIHVTTQTDSFDVDPNDLKVANLASKPDEAGKEVWAWPARYGKVLIDPELGRFVLPTSAPYRRVRAVHVTWHYGRAHQIGGYERAATQVPLTSSRDIVFPSSTVYSHADLTGVTSVSGDFVLTLRGANPQIMALEGAAPTLDLNGRLLRIKCDDGANLRLSGLRIINGRIATEGQDVTVAIEDCTFYERASPRDKIQSAWPKYTLSIGLGQAVTLRRSVCGAIEMQDDVELSVIDSIVQSRTLQAMAIYMAERTSGQTLSIVRSTVLGRVESFSVGGSGPGDFGGMDVTGDNSRAEHGISNAIIVTDPEDENLGLNITTTHEGCVRYSRLPGQTRAPRPFQCVPKSGQNERDFYPRFTSTDLMNPAYMQLDHSTVQAISNGADNGSEMGVGCRQLTHIRMSNLKRTTEDFLRFGFAAGPIFEN